MHFLKIKSHLVVKLFIIVLSFCAVSILSSPIHAYQNSDSSQALNVIEDEPIPELLAEINSEQTGEIIPEGYQWWDSDCAGIYILARIFDEIYKFFPTLEIGICKRWIDFLCFYKFFNRFPIFFPSEIRQTSMKISQGKLR